MPTTARNFLQPGDNLLYRPGKGFFGWLISFKTWHEISHCECYVGDGKSVASRDGVGVGLYDVRLNGLIWIMRPKDPFLLGPAMDTFRRKYQGQGYDWMGLLRFAWRAPVDDRVRFNNKQFCSEFLTRFDRDGGIDPFPGEDADAVAPFQFRYSPVFTAHGVDKDGYILESPR